ncbi:MAG: hypothetical protein AW12_00715 [Candidatus Accumulibacter sp. BA-94]|nr:MAG: hypothetical protein AW12_00715 [Candidatus Accumulibacter sp. BA-94]
MQAAVLPGSEPFALPLQQRLARALAGLGPDCAPRTQHRDEQGRPRFSNRLLLESSPYLLQHAHNPVNWFPWGDEAFVTRLLSKRHGSVDRYSCRSAIRPVTGVTSWRASPSRTKKSLVS